MRFFATGPRIMGIRPGVSVRVSQLAAMFKQRGNKSAMTGSFVYVVEGQQGRSKIGVSTDPLRRLAQLQTGSAFPLSFAYLAVTPGNGYDIEAGVLDALASKRVSGEWFDAEPGMLVAAIHGVSHQISQPVQQVKPEWVPEIIRQAMLTGPQNTRQKLPAWLFPVIGGAVAFFFFLALLVG